MRGSIISRRDFLKGITVLCASSVSGISGLELCAVAAEADDATLGDIEKETIRSFTDTIIPGPTSDPEGSVGGVEAGALEVLYDPYYGLSPFIGMLSRNLNWTSICRYGKLFRGLDLSQRTAILLSKEDAPLIKFLYEQAGILVKLAFYGAIINDVGTEYISFPGPSSGYHDYSFNEKFAEEATEDGNLP